MKEKNKLIIAVITVLLIGVTVAGSTYAYWTWRSANNQQTNISFNVANDNTKMYANLEGGGSTTAQNLAPVTCTSSNYTTYGIKKKMTLKYLNNTTQAASIKGTLTITAWTPAHGTIPAAALGKINYRVTTSGTNCNQTALSGPNGSGTNTSMSGTFPSSITAGTTKLIDNVELKNVAAGTATEGSQDYYLWIWIDSSYTYENVGNVVSDPLQDLQFTVKWTGTISNA